MGTLHRLVCSYYIYTYYNYNCGGTMQPSPSPTLLPTAQRWSLDARRRPAGAPRASTVRGVAAPPPAPAAAVVGQLVVDADGVYGGFAIAFSGGLGGNLFSINAGK